jgi:hypothetical protein
VDFVGNHGTTEDEPGEGREDEPFRRGEKKQKKKCLAVATVTFKYESLL